MDKLNQRGFILSFFKGQSLIIKILLIFIVTVILIPSVMYAFPIAKYVVMALISFFILELVINSLGNNVLSYLITGVLLYFIVWKYLFFSTSLFVIYLFLGAGFMSVLIWGTARFSKKH